MSEIVEKYKPVQVNNYIMSGCVYISTVANSYCVVHD